MSFIGRTKEEFFPHRLAQVVRNNSWLVANAPLTHNIDYAGILRLYNILHLLANSE